MSDTKETWKARALEAEEKLKDSYDTISMLIEEATQGRKCRIALRKENAALKEALDGQTLPIVAEEPTELLLSSVQRNESMGKLQVSALISAINTALMTPLKEKVPAKWEVVKLNEHRFWNEHNEEGKFFLANTETYFGLYAFNSNSHSFLCEVTPSYELHRVGSDYGFNEAGNELSDDERERLHTIVDESERDEEPVTYMHVSSIENMRASNPAGFKTVEVDPDTLEADDPDLAAVDEIRERICTGSFHF